MLRCPRCRGPLTDTELGLHCADDRLTYPVVDGEARVVDECAIAD